MYIDAILFPSDPIKVKVPFYIITQDTYDSINAGTYSSASDLNKSLVNIFPSFMNDICYYTYNSNPMYDRICEVYGSSNVKTTNRLSSGFADLYVPNDTTMSFRISVTSSAILSTSLGSCTGLSVYATNTCNMICSLIICDSDGNFIKRAWFTIYIENLAVTKGIISEEDIPFRTFYLKLPLKQNSNIQSQIHSKKFLCWRQNS